MATDNGWKRSPTSAGAGCTPGRSCPEGSCRVTPFRKNLIEEVGADRTAMSLSGARPLIGCYLYNIYRQGLTGRASAR